MRGIISVVGCPGSPPPWEYGGRVRCGRSEKRQGAGSSRHDRVEPEAGEHVMKTFVADGRPMSEAGPHFPHVSAEFDVLPPPPRPQAGEVGPLTRVGGRAGTGER